MEKGTLGQILKAHEPRDAVHIAIITVRATEELKPGQHINVGGYEQLYTVSYGAPIGIVDPFLKESVEPEQLFHMILFPNTVTGLRHSWTHASLPDEESESGYDDGCRGC